ncbi:MAG: hypothetical protein ACI9MU_001632, partial [Alphaproteobacteria bacterium]
MNMFNIATVRKSGCRSTAIQRDIQRLAQRPQPIRGVWRGIDQPFADFRLIYRKHDPTY